MIGTAIGAACALAGGVWKSNRDRRIAAKDAFRIFIEIKKLDIPDSGCARFKVSSVKEIWVEFARLTLFLNGYERERMKADIQAFGSIDENILADQYITDNDDWRIKGAAWAEGLCEAAPDPDKPRPNLADDPRYILLNHLDAIIKSVFSNNLAHHYLDFRLLYGQIHPHPVDEVSNSSWRKRRTRE